MKTRSSDETLIAALRILAEDIVSDDGVANAAIAEAADRLEEYAFPFPINTPIDVEKVHRLRRQMMEFNKLDLADISLRKGDAPLPVTPEIIDQWRVIGLSNVSFVELEFWDKNTDETSSELMAKAGL